MIARAALILGLVVASLAPLPASAGFRTGNELLRMCTSDAPGQINECIGYIEGAQDGSEWVKAYCLPAGTEAGQLKEAVVKALLDNVADRAFLASTLVENALATTWPCPKPHKPLKPK